MREYAELARMYAERFPLRVLHREVHEHCETLQVFEVSTWGSIAHLETVSFPALTPDGRTIWTYHAWLADQLERASTVKQRPQN